MRTKRTTPIFICFTGIDGSGKTTLAKSLAEAMRKRGMPARYVYTRFQPWLTRPLFRLGQLIFMRGENFSQNYTGYSSARRNLLQKSLFFRIYGAILLSDYFLQAMLKVRLPLLTGNTVVCDRYVFDTVVTDLAVDVNYSIDRINRTIRRYLTFFPKPDVVFLVDAPEEVAYHRKNDVPSIDYLTERRRLYLGIARHYGMTILDGSKELTGLQSEIESRIFQ